MDQPVISPLEKINRCLSEGQSFVLQGGAGSGKTETLKRLCCVIKFKDRTTPFRVFLNQYDKFQAYLTQ